LPDDEVIFAMQGECQRLLAEAGFDQYEVSAYSREGRQCRHYLNYWRFGDYVGIGAGAHGKTTSVTTGEVTRTERVKQPGRFMSASRAEQRVSATRVVVGSDLAFEFFLNALRLNEGIEPSLFEERTGLSFDTVSAAIAEACKRGLLEWTPGSRWAPTVRGRLFLNDLQAIFLGGKPGHGSRA
jgi:oxygen-independent coproporphyrinogen-3 oxidase